MTTKTSLLEATYNLVWFFLFFVGVIILVYFFLFGFCGGYVLLNCVFGGVFLLYGICVDVFCDFSLF